ncbi:MAG: NADP oxidoreductase [Methylothermaceae bacteria B42]|nr:MAG: NADP oxidoreductase [Methylothermaceae bacteria B42]HHJ39262.1 2Fe-2S iron-sulfur cluster binding domain-containing protein [Methylothermaceae bacterium]
MPTLIIDGQTIDFEPDQTIIEAAMAAGIYIPHLCWHPEFPPHGSCKLCSVKVNGRLCSACSFPAAEGQEVVANSEELRQLRLALTQMLFVEGNHFCPSCEKSGQCELQAMGYYVGMTDNHYPHFFPIREIDASHPHVLLDRDRCIFCELCVRASQAEGKNVFELAERGIHTRLVVNSPTGKLGDSDLDVNDRAAHICPVGAIIIKETAFRTPIGQRKYDHKTIAQVSLAEEAPLVRKRND